MLAQWMQVHKSFFSQHKMYDLYIILHLISKDEDKTFSLYNTVNSQQMYNLCITNGTVD